MAMAMARALAIALAGAPAPSAEGLPITCGETRRSTSEGGNHVLAAYEFTATAGAVYSFRSTVQPSPLFGHLASVSLRLHPLGGAWAPEPVYPDSSGTAWICAWEAPETGVYEVLQEGGSNWGWDISLRMDCGSPPAACQVSVAPKTWSGVKFLFRD
jgi:hypothetical protein